VITEWLLGLAVWLGQVVLGMMPDTGAEDLVGSASGVVANVVSMGSGITVWFPWGVAAMCGVVTFTAWGLLFVFKIARQLLAHVPQFGGSG
jgi:hypothetical protein